MRVLAATGICVALAAVAGGAQAREVSIYRGKCGEVVLPSGPTGLDSAVRIDTSCGSFAIDRHGIRSVGRRKRMIDGLLWLRRRLLFYERGRVVWRSPRWHGESPSGWTKAGLLIYSETKMLTARTPSGRAVARFAIARRAPHRFDPESRTFLYVSPGRELVRTDGRRSETVAALGPLRLGRLIEMFPLEEGRVGLLGRRLVVLGSDGSVVASDRHRAAFPALTSHGAIAMVATGLLRDDGRAREAVRLLRRGDRASRLLHITEVGALGCGHWPALEWHGDHLLYSTTEGHVVVIDAVSGDHVDLTAVVGRLPGAFREATWA